MRHRPHLFVEVEIRILHGPVIFRDERFLAGMSVKEALELFIRDGQIPSVT
jgi:hypothetical protein